MAGPVLENATAPLARYTLSESVGASQITEVVAGHGKLKLDTPNGVALVDMADGMALEAAVGAWYVVHEDGHPSIRSDEWFQKHCTALKRE